MKAFYVIFRQGGDLVGPQFNTQPEAEEQAKRHAGKLPNTSFYVAQVLGCVQVPLGPAQWEWYEDLASDFDPPYKPSMPPGEIVDADFDPDPDEAEPEKAPVLDDDLPW